MARMRKTGETNPDDAAAESRRKEAAALYIRGHTQADIGKRLGVNQATISRDLAEVRKQWLASAVMDFNARQAQELAKVDAVEEAAWAAWERSCKDAETSHAEMTRGRASAAGQPLPDLSKTSKTLKGQAGDPRFLERVGWCVEQRCKILGLHAAQKHDITVTAEERRTRLLGLLDTLRQRSGVEGN